MLVFGGIIGLLLSLVAIAGPTAASMSAALATSFVPPVALIFTISWQLGLALQFIVTLVLYLLAALVTPPVPGRVPNNGFEQFCRGMQIGINSAANGCYFVAVVPALFVLIGSPSVGPVLAFAIVLATVNFLCVFEGLTNAFAFEAVVAWSAWFLPMNWLYQLLGLIFFIVCSALSLLGMSFTSLGAWWPGTVARHGFPFGFGGAFTLGNFTIVSPDILRSSPRFVGASASPDTALGIISHEVGHTLTNAAFGNFFGVIFWVHERIWSFFGMGGMTYGEMICEGVRRSHGIPAAPAANPWLPMWAPPVTLPAGGGNSIPTAEFRVDGSVAANGDRFSGASGTAVTLEIVGATDDDSYPMGNVSPGGTPSVGFAWNLTPPTPISTAVIAAPNSATTQFTPDVTGDYIIDAIVSDGAEGSFIRVHVDV
jgi:hypothetical protein